MSKRRHVHSTLIDLIGAEKVRTTFGLSSQRLHMWRVRGIPHLKRIAFAKLAADRGVAVPNDFFAEMAA